MTRSIFIAFAVLAFATLGLRAAAVADAGHDHGAETAAPAASAVPRLVAEGSEWELVATAEDHTLTIFLDRRATNAPVEGAKIEVMSDGIAAAPAKEIGNGIYELEGDWMHEPGTKALTFTVFAGEKADLLAGLLVIPPETDEAHGPAVSWRDILARPETWMLAVIAGFCGFFLAFAFRPLRLPPDAGAVLIAILAAGASALPSPVSAHEGHDHGPPAAASQAGGSAPAKLPSGEVYLPKATQRLLNLRTAPAAVSRTQIGTELVGTVAADPVHEGRVQAPMEGQIELAEGELSYVGKEVKAGDVLALLAPAMPVYERGALMQLTAEVDGKLRIAEQKLTRLLGISGDYIPQREIQDTRTEIESLREQKRVLEPKAAERLEMKAPLPGIISVANVRAGQVVSARETLFEIVDPQRLWIEAIGIAGADDVTVSSATAVDGEGHRIGLTYIGRAPALRQQGLPLLFRVDEPHVSMAIGATVRVLVKGGTEAEGMVVPDSAVVQAPHGLSQVWIKVAPERFAPRPVRTEHLDGARVLITSGIEAGDRVVVEGAELVNQVR